MFRSSSSVIRSVCTLLLPLAIAGLAHSPAALGAEASPPPSIPPWQLDAVPPVDYQRADRVVGSGTPESVTAEALQRALDGGGIITFDTGGRPATILVARELILPQGVRPTVIDGQGLVTLDGQGKTRILGKQWKTELTVQRLRFQNGVAGDCGGAINTDVWDGTLGAIDCEFINCRTTRSGPDIGGGAIYAGGQHRFLLSGCSFTGCQGSNGGAVGSLGCQIDFVNCSFIGNKAFGVGGGADAGPTGQGGIGGAYAMDGCSQSADQHHAYISSCYFKDNIANDHGGVVFNYCYQNTGSVVAYYACIFENNQVATIPGQHMGWPGGIYIQDGQCIFSACSFLGNSSPKGPAALFLITPYQIGITDCEFSGNMAGGGEDQPSFPGTATVQNVSYRRPDTPIAVLALNGRWPGVPAATPPPTAAPAAHHVAVHHAPAAPLPSTPPATLLDRSQLVRWDAVVLTSVRQSLSRGRSPRFMHHQMHVEISISELDADRTIHGTMGGGDIQLAWASLGDADRLDLISDCAQDIPLDQACLAFYQLLFNRSRDEVYKHLSAAGAAGQDVLTAFGIADLTALAKR